MIVSGFCHCEFPAIHKCVKCGEKLCNNHFPSHVCSGDLFPAAKTAKVIKPGIPPRTK